MSAFSDKFSLFIPKKTKIPTPNNGPDVDLGDNWRTIEQWANDTGLISFLASTTPPEAWVTALPSPLQTKFFIQAEGDISVTFNGATGQGTVTYKKPFPNGTIACIPSFATIVGAGVTVTLHCVAATATTAQLDCRSIAGAAVAYVGGAQQISYIAIGW